MKQATKSFLKWSLANWLFILSAAALVLVLLLVITGPRAPKIEVRQLTKTEAILQNYSLSYPVFSNESVNATLRAYAQQQADSFLFAKKRQFDPTERLTVTYQLLHVGARTASVVFYKKEQLLNKPQVISKEVISVDLTTGTRLNFTYAFSNTNKATELLGKIIYNYFLHEKPGQLTPAGLQQLADFGQKHITNFSFTNNALIFDVAAQSINGQSVQTVSIKKELLKLVLRPELAGYDRNTVQVSAHNPGFYIETMPKFRPPIDPTKPMIALTFDDGPSNYTPQLLDVLAQYNAKATFFVIGQEVEKRANTLQRIAAEGHEIGNHSLNHPNLTLLTPPELTQQLVATQQLIQKATGGYTPATLRPPQGVTNPAVTNYAQSLGLKVELWNIDTQDWRYRDSVGVYDYTMAHARDGGVVLMHDIYPTSVEAATHAIADLSAAGYQLVTLSELRQYR